MSVQVCLGDVDIDEQMSEEMIKTISTQDATYDAVVELHGKEFQDVSVRSGYSSSSGLIDEETQQPVYISNSQHLYWTLLNANSSQDLDRYVEFLKRRAVIKKFWFLKIHKDGSTSFRILLDLSVIKSMQSRLSFEAPATVGEGLKKIQQESKFYNTENGLIPFDLHNVDYKGLPDWRVVYEQAKIDNEDKINAVKKQYRADKILELVQLYNLSEAEAALIIDEYLSKSIVSASMILKGTDNNPYRVYQFLTQDATKWDVYDIFDYKKGLGKTHINVKNIFNATIYTYLRGGVTYNISFTLDEIIVLLATLDFTKDVKKVLFSLVDYIVSNEFNKDDVNTIIDLLQSKNCSFEFEKYYYKNYINFTVQAKMSDFAFMMMDGKTGVFRKSEDGDLTLYTIKSISDLFLNKNFYSKDPNNLSKTILIDVVKHWLRSQEREEFTSVVFTDKDTKEDEYNLFGGFAYEPINHSGVDLQPYFELVKDVIAGGDELFCNVNHSFVAQMLQDPFNKLGTALVLSGKKRIGKGSFIKIIGALIGGNHYFQTNQPDKVFGRFNIQLLRTILVYLNEAFWSGDKSMEGRIKGIITDDDFSYEIKGGAIFGGKNATRLILDSNEKYIVPATEDEGRYIVEGVSDCKKGDKEFFTSVNDLRTSQKAMEKLMYFYMNFDYKPYEHYLREAPKSKFLIEQISQNFSKIQEWWFRNLQEGNIYKANYVMDADGIKISNEALWESFKEFHKGKTQYEKQQSFYSDLKDLLDGVVVRSGVKVSAGVTGKVIAPLHRARELFTHIYLVSDFDDMVDWSQPYTLDIPLPIPFCA
ncbi:hypothetical protein GJV85_03490 [Sulfurimonas aquatica]|uniref:NrS-1 polymerase-like helicase domain-containing protein n=1 Tax=Sulfurimonas aquatica TaxID=2672570 RepID=A0A975GCE4_9BACT|nr:primase-helicase family protein [Sulfurimonas aquatica]QSZ41213.1 hypothetical protein GJV85_03490 [Sulfurimonas aquatica]